jgi:hypothetical protein
VALTPLSEAGERIAAAAAAELAATSADTVIDRDRAVGHGYYRDVCFKVNALLNDMLAEIGDGSFTEWAARLLTSKKERLLISGYGLDRFAALIDDQGFAADAAQAGTASLTRNELTVPPAQFSSRLLIGSRIVVRPPAV